MFKYFFWLLIVLLGTGRADENSTATFIQGEVYWTDLGVPIGFEMDKIKARDGLEADSIVLIDQIRSVSPLRFKKPQFLTQLTAPEMDIVQKGIAQILAVQLDLSRTQPLISNETDPELDKKCISLDTKDRQDIEQKMLFALVYTIKFIFELFG